MKWLGLWDDIVSGFLRADAGWTPAWHASAQFNFIIEMKARVSRHHVPIAIGIDSGSAGRVILFFLLDQKETKSQELNRFFLKFYLHSSRFYKLTFLHSFGRFKQYRICTLPPFWIQMNFWRKNLLGSIILKILEVKIEHPFVAARKPENIWSRQGVNAFLLKNQEM